MKASLPPQRRERKRLFQRRPNAGSSLIRPIAHKIPLFVAEWSWMEVSRDLGKCLINWKTLIGIFTRPTSAIWVWLGQINCAETLLFCRQETKTHRSNYLTGPNKSQTVREIDCKTALTSWYRFLQGIPRVGTELLENHFTTLYLFFSWFSYPQT